MKRQEERRKKRSAYVKSYVLRSIDLIDREEPRRIKEEDTYL